MQLPTVPSFVANETSVSHLQQLSSAAAFCSVAYDIPMWRCNKAASQTLTVSTWNTVFYATVELDTDHVYSTTINGVQLNTQGYYECEACLSFEQTTAGGVYNMRFLWTAGYNNPNYSQGTTVIFGGCGGHANGGTAGANDYTYCIADVCPVVCYPNDTIVVQSYPSGANTFTDTLINTAATAGWYAPQFSGRWIRTGS